MFSIGSKQRDHSKKFLLPCMTGKGDLRSRMISVFKTADREGNPIGKLDHIELTSRLGVFFNVGGGTYIAYTSFSCAR